MEQGIISAEQGTFSKYQGIEGIREFVADLGILTGGKAQPLPHEQIDAHEITATAGRQRDNSWSWAHTQKFTGNFGKRQGAEIGLTV
jgi:hypothetical protein